MGVNKMSDADVIRIAYSLHVGEINDVQARAMVDGDENILAMVHKARAEEAWKSDEERRAEWKRRVR